MLNTTKEDLESADKEIQEFENEYLSKIPGGFGAPLTRAEKALLKTYILYKKKKS